MPLYQSDAFVLRTYQLGEHDQIVVFFTRDFGKLRAVARHSCHPRRYTASYYQPLTLLYAILFGRPSQSLYRVNTVDIVQPFRLLHESFEFLRCGFYVTELVDVATREREPMPELFALLRLTLERLPEVAPPTKLVRWFELRLLMSIGYTPQLVYCAHCARELLPHENTFSPYLGGVVCTACAAKVSQTLSVSRATLKFLRLAIMSAQWPSMELDAAAQQDLERLLHAHLTLCLGRELKSYTFLHL